MEGLRPLAAVMKPPLNVTYITSREQFPLLVDFFARCKTFGLDVETTLENDFFKRRVRTIQVGNTKEQFVIDLLSLCGNDPELLISCQGAYGLNNIVLQDLMELLRPVLCSNEYLKVGVNLGFEYICFYWNFGLRIWHLFDCSVIERLIWAGYHSLAHYDWYSMEEMVARYLFCQVDKTLQTSFTIDQPLTPEQIDYAALDTRLPMALMIVQNLILRGETHNSLLTKNDPQAIYLKHVPSYLLGDNMLEISQIENNCIGSFQDMHVHGDRIDRKLWNEITEENIKELEGVIKTLDTYFVPLFGNKDHIQPITLEEVLPYKNNYYAAQEKFKQLETAYKLDKANTALKVAKKAAEIEKKKFYALYLPLRNQLNAYIETLQYEGEAKINYGSTAQMLKAFQEKFDLKKMKSTEDDDLALFKDTAAVEAFRKYRKLSKAIGTYGLSWTQEWTTHPCKEEGWLNPGDGRIHHVFNQLAAETGRSSSEKPNGQNLPKDTKARKDKYYRACFVADPPDESEPEGYELITIDMSGAELRILAEESKEPAWVDAFNRGEDVHAVCTELQYPEEWPVWAAPGCDYFKPHTEETVAKNPLCVLGDPQRQKCECPEHKPKRDETKVPNFLIPYGGGASNLAVQLGKSIQRCKEILQLHKKTFPKLWAYLNKSADFAVRKLKSFDMYGRRRGFNRPNYDISLARARKDFKDKLKLDPEVVADNVKAFIEVENRQPTKEELYKLSYDEPTDEMIDAKYTGMWGFIERAGKNHPIQGTNVTIAKIAMGCGFDADGKPFLWHVLPKYKARLQRFVHDELVIHVPKRLSKELVAVVKDAFKRAAAIKMKLVVMESDANIAPFWKK